MTTTYEITDNQAWYLRSAIFRALTLNKKEIDTLEEFLASDDAKETPRSFIASIEGSVAYMKQWDRETRQYLSELPVALVNMPSEG